ncbi:hypothetical protein GCM10008018_54590 [Paenibacillus marchantiophytorum]|uniref:Uncharacterized protein n=1 Tax=Paenibacillus marchantiophytorum TaxID=1619310 RepID=A0ABQ1F6Y7_9BACL|nr:hypothetical protein [Paenibacillus marchantiophytorum]GGA01305.1 hypothetical protein GCM10008018_54590 [Paenibacillus marchantiophytorum]
MTWRQDFRLHFDIPLPMELRAQDQILITVGEVGKLTWADFIGTVVECGQKLGKS